MSDSLHWIDFKSEHKRLLSKFMYRINSDSSSDVSFLLHTLNCENDVTRNFVAMICLCQGTEIFTAFKVPLA